MTMYTQVTEPLIMARVQRHINPQTDFWGRFDPEGLACSVI